MNMRNQTKNKHTDYIFTVSGITDSFLANDVTKVTSWLMSSKLENHAFQNTVSVFNLPEGVFCEMLGGGVPVGH